MVLTFHGSIYLYTIWFSSYKYHQVTFSSWNIRIFTLPPPHSLSLSMQHRYTPLLVKLIFRDYNPNDYVNTSRCWDIQIWPSFFFSVFFPQGNNHCLKLSKQETNASVINLSLNSDRTVSTCLNTSRRVFVFECFPSQIYLSHLWLDQVACTPLPKHILAGWQRKGTHEYASRRKPERGWSLTAICPGVIKNFSLEKEPLTSL